MGVEQTVAYGVNDGHVQAPLYNTTITVAAFQDGMLAVEYASPTTSCSELPLQVRLSKDTLIAPHKIVSLEETAARHL